MTEIINVHIPEHLVSRQQAKRSERVVQVIAVVVAVACFIPASMLVTPLDNLRTEYQLTLDPKSTRGLPPDIALMTKAGTLRALAIDFAFMRMEKLKQDNKYYEINKLSDVVCKLAPRFPSVWRYSAWNQAYNISVAQYTPEGRWYWVKKGINQLRNEGIRYNPKAIGLYTELAYIFWHKVGDFLDDHHWYYKKQLACEMERILGPPPVAVDDQQIIDSFARVAQATQPPDQLIQSDAEVASLVERLAKLGLQPDEGLLEFVARNLRNQLQVSDILRDLEEDSIRTQKQARVELLTNPNNIPARDRLLASLRHQALIEKFNMDPAWMLQLMHDYGPLDWRGAYMHALYWSTRGDMITKGQLNLDENDSMNTVRYIFFGLALTIKRGKIIFEPDFDDPGNSYLELMSDSRFIPYLHQTYLRLGKEQFGDDPRFREGTAGPNYENGHYTFLGDAVRQLYTEGGSKNVEQAEKLYAYLRKYNLQDDGSPQPQYMQPLKSFVLQDFKQDLVSFKTANMQINAWVYRSLKLLAIGEVEAGVHAMQWAKTAWEYYMKDKYTDVGDSKRRHLAPLSDMRADIAVQFLQDPYTAFIHKIRLWRSLELPTRQAAYDRVAPVLKKLCDENDPPMDMARAFPEPPGMDEYRLKKPPPPTREETSIDQGEKAW